MIINKSLAFLFVLLSTVSCAKDKRATSDGVTASFQSQIEEQSGAYVWKDGSKILLTNGSTSETVTLKKSDISADGSTAAFRVSLQGNIYAVYPASAYGGITGSTMTVNIPASQDGTFESANICVAKSSGRELKFSTAVAMLKFTSKAAEISQIEVSAAGIAGDSKVNFLKGLSASEGSVNRVSITAGESAAPYYIAAAPMELPAGTRFAFKNGGNTVGTVTLSSAKALSAGKVYDCGEAKPGDVDPEPEDPQSIAYFLDNGIDFEVKTSFIGAVVPQDETHWVAQGGTSDGKYVYFSIRTSTSVGDDDAQRVVIYKYTLSPFAFVSKSEPIACGHANDMTYNSVDNTLIHAHGSNQSKILTVINLSLPLKYGI